MTAPQMLEYIGGVIAAALPGWKVYPYPAPDAAHQQVDMHISGATYGGFVFGGHQILESVVVRFGISTGYTDLETRQTYSLAETYGKLLESRDAATKALLQATQALSGTELLVQKFPQATAPDIMVNVGKTQQFWEMTVSFALERKL